MGSGREDGTAGAAPWSECPQGLWVQCQGGRELGAATGWLGGGRKDGGDGHVFLVMLRSFVCRCIVLAMQKRVLYSDVMQGCQQTKEII